MITIKITSWERERRPHSYWYKPQPRGGTTPASWREEATSMEMNPGALPRPGRMPSQEFWSPKACWRWRQRSELLLEKRGSEARFSRQKYKYEPKGGTEGGPSRPGGHPARVDFWSRQEGAWGLCATPGPHPLARGLF